MGRCPIPAGFAAAALAAMLWFGWDSFAGWYNWRSGFTDLPGQDSLAPVNRLGLPVLALIAVVAGRLTRVLCRATRWTAVLIAVSPLLLLLLVSVDEGNPLDIWYGFVLICLLGFFGASNAPGLSRRQRATG